MSYPLSKCSSWLLWGQHMHLLNGLWGILYLTSGLVDKNVNRFAMGNWNHWSILEYTHLCLTIVYYYFLQPIQKMFIYFPWLFNFTWQFIKGEYVFILEVIVENRVSSELQNHQVDYFSKLEFIQTCPYFSSSCPSNEKSGWQVWFWNHFFLHNFCNTHLLDKEIYQLTDHFWVRGNWCASAFSSHLHR